MLFGDDVRKPIEEIIHIGGGPIEQLVDGLVLGLEVARHRAYRHQSKKGRWLR